MLVSVGGELCDDGSFIIPLNDETSMPFFNALLASSSNRGGRR